MEAESEYLHLRKKCFVKSRAKRSVLQGSFLWQGEKKRPSHKKVEKEKEIKKQLKIVPKSITCELMGKTKPFARLYFRCPRVFLME